MIPYRFAGSLSKLEVRGRGSPIAYAERIHVGVVTNLFVARDREIDDESHDCKGPIADIKRAVDGSGNYPVVGECQGNTRQQRDNKKEQKHQYKSAENSPSVAFRQRAVAGKRLRLIVSFNCDYRVDERKPNRGYDSRNNEQYEPPPSIAIPASQRFPKVRPH